MNKKSRMLALFSILLVSGWLAACEKKDGPAEEFGEKVDEATKDLGRKMEDAGEKMKDAAD